jgi:hypothetical protein
MFPCCKTPINVKKLEELLEFYPNTVDAQILLDGSTSGFKVNYEGPCCSYDSIGPITLIVFKTLSKEVYSTDDKSGSI